MLHYSLKYFQIKSFKYNKKRKDENNKEKKVNGVQKSVEGLELKLQIPKFFLRLFAYYVYVCGSQIDL